MARAKKTLSIVPPRARLSPKQFARAYMRGDLTDEQIDNQRGGMGRLVRMAENAESDIASGKALEQLTKLAGIENEIETSKSIKIKLNNIDEMLHPPMTGKINAG